MSDLSAEASVEASASNAITLVEAVRQALHEEMQLDPTVVVLGEDVGRKGGVFKATVGLQDAFGPLRVMDTPVSEIAIAGAAVGAAMMGLRPVAEFQFADYMHPAWDQIVNQAATMHWRSVGAWRVPAVFRAPIGAGVRGGVYHSQNVESFFCHVPGLKVVVPATPRDAKGLLKSAIRDDDPVVFFEHKWIYRRVREPVPLDETLPIGKARVDQVGSHLSIITYGVGLHHSRAATETLARDGISAEILDLRTLAPLDLDAIARTVAKTGRVVLVHEANKTMGIGAEISAFIAEELFMDLDAPIRRVASADCHLPYNAAEEQAIIPNPQNIELVARQLAHF